jgi:hypothetical protein
MPSGIFVDATTALANAITAIGLVPITDPRNARPLTVYIEPPSFDAFNAGQVNSVADLTYTIRILAAPPGNQDATDYLLTTMDTIYNSSIVVMSGRPSLTVVGSQEIPSYDLTVRMSARRS